MKLFLYFRGSGNINKGDKWGDQGTKGPFGRYLSHKAPSGGWGTDTSTSIGSWWFTWRIWNPGSKADTQTVISLSEGWHTLGVQS